MIGQTLDHYRIVDRLGSGGMGVVWLAEDLRLRRRVALKMLREDLANAPDKAIRFEREAKAIAALSHPNIVTIHAIEKIDGHRFLAMEHLEGQTLADLIPPTGFPLLELLRIAAPVADALAAAHARGITHRDLKPANIFVTSDGRVKVLDFGLAKLQEGEVTRIYGQEFESSLTQEGTVVGTLHYMSPEQLQLRHVDQRSDLYSFGVVLYEMATGDLPFGGESAAQVITAVLRDRARRIDDLDTRLPTELAELVASCLEKDPGRRLASAAEARERLVALSHALETGALSLAGSRLRRLVGGANRMKLRRLAVALVALATLSVLLPWAMRELRGSSPRPAAAAVEVAVAPIPAIAVLPLANFSGDPDYFVDGMSDGLIGALGRLPGVRVISRQSAMHYKGSKQRLPEIARELGVDFLVEGSVTRDGDAIRLQARLVRPDPEQQVWADAFDRSLSEAPALHETVALAVARAAGARVEEGAVRRTQGTRAVDPRGYEAFLQGRYFADRFDEEGMRAAESHFRRAVALVPSYAPAWVGLADSLLKQWKLNPGAQELRRELTEALDRALELDSESAEGFAVLAELHLTGMAWQEAEAAVRRALELDPSSAAAHRQLWNLEACRGRGEEALEAIRTASRLDPLSTRFRAGVGIQLLILDRHQEAIRELERVLELDPDDVLGHAYLWVAWSSLEKDPERGQELLRYLAGLGLTDHLAEFERRSAADGFEPALRWLALRLAADTQALETRLGVVAGLLAQAGELDLALDLLEEGYERRAWELGWTAVAPDLRNLHGLPRFNRLLDRLGLPRPTR